MHLLRILLIGACVEMGVTLGQAQTIASAVRSIRR